MKGFLRLIAFIVIALFIQSYLAGLFQGFNSGRASCAEISLPDTILGNSAVRHKRFWRDQSNYDRFCMEYAYEDFKNVNSESYRNQLKTVYTDSYIEYWGHIYQSLYLQDSSELFNLRDSLRSVQIKKSLDRTEFAHMVVKFVQDIPYNYILSEPCEGTKDGRPCRGDSRFGILSPVEFLY